MWWRRYRLGVPAVVTGGLVLLAGCGEGREYVVPETACGVRVGEEALSPLLPDGAELRERTDPLWERRGHCRISVDQTRVISVTFSQVEKLYDPMAESEGYKFTNRKGIPELPFPGKGALGDRSAMVTAECGGSGPPYLVVDVLVDKGVNGDIAERRTEVRKFTEEYVSGARQKLGCDTT